MIKNTLIKPDKVEYVGRPGAPRICVFTDILSEEEHGFLVDFCRSNKDNFKRIGYSVTTRWDSFFHTEKDIHYKRAFFIDEQENSSVTEQKVEKIEEDLVSNVGVLNLTSELEDDFLKAYFALCNVLDTAVEKIKQIYDVEAYRELNPWITYQAEGQYMDMHIDGPFSENRGHHTEFSSVYYINDDFDGGDFIMPVMGFTYKPKANSMIMFSHSWHEDMLHEVNAVVSGDRFLCQGFFSSKK